MAPLPSHSLTCCCCCLTLKHAEAGAVCRLVSIGVDVVKEVIVCRLQLPVRQQRVQIGADLGHFTVSALKKATADLLHTTNAKTNPCLILLSYWPHQTPPRTYKPYQHRVCRTSREHGHCLTLHKNPRHPHTTR